MVRAIIIKNIGALLIVKATHRMYIVQAIYYPAPRIKVVSRRR